MDVMSREIRPGIFSVGAVDWDGRLFDALIPLPDGTSYNSYLIKGKSKTALIDTVDPPMWGVLMNHLEQFQVKDIDYIISNHAEQDHSGSIPQVLAKFPRASVVATPKAKDMLVDLLMIPAEKIITVADKETISLGGRTLEFIHAPWVHWPETMLTYLREDHILFPCDFFGSHLATSSLYVTDEGQVSEAAKRYFAEIMMPFSAHIQGHLEKLKGYKIDLIAPSHGPMYDKPEFVMEEYRRWVSDKPGNIVALPYVTMHGSTRKMVEYLVEALAEKHVTVKQFALPVTDIGKLAIALVDAATIVVGTPTMLGGPHPAAVYPLVVANALRPKLKFASVVGSYGWGGKTVEVVASLIPNLKVEFLPAVLAKGHPKEADFKALDSLADAIARKHKEQGLT